MKKLQKYFKIQIIEQRGITLIALVITIIVLLILAGVTIATLTGKNGILTRASEASEKTEEAGAKEQVQLAVTGSIGTDGKLENGTLKDNLNKIENISGVPEEITDESYPLVVTVDGKYSYVINKDGTVGDAIKREGIEVGDYVNYTYDEKADGYNLLTTQSGHTSNQTVSQTTGLKWRILNIHVDGTVDLISEAVPSQNVSFGGALGYNNGVYLLNDICKNLYSNSKLGITARSIELEDIEGQMNEEGIAARNAYVSTGGNVKYGSTKTYTGSYSNYPNLYARENGSGINTEETKKNGIGVSDNGYTNPTTETSTTANSLTVTQSYYYFSNTPRSYFDNSEVYDMLLNTGTYYWLSSRYVNCDTPDAGFGLCNIGDSGIGGYYTYASNNKVNSNLARVRPIVSLETNIKIIACEDENDSTNMHQISK